MGLESELGLGSGKSWGGLDSFPSAKSAKSANDTPPTEGGGTQSLVLLSPLSAHHQGKDDEKEN